MEKIVGKVLSLDLFRRFGKDGLPCPDSAINFHICTKSIIIYETLIIDLKSKQLKHYLYVSFSKGCMCEERKNIFTEQGKID